MRDVVFAVIDDDKKEIARIIYILSDAAEGHNVKFDIFSPKTDAELDGVLRKLESRSYSGVIIDQLLGDHSYITLQGIQIANRLRNINESLPIFILTKYIGDESLLRFGFSIDDAIDKNQIINHPEAFLGRLLRSTKRYITQNEELEDSLNELIKKSYERTLSREENDKLIEIKIKLTPSGLIQGALKSPTYDNKDELNRKLDETLNILSRLEKEQNQ